MRQATKRNAPAASRGGVVVRLRPVGFVEKSRGLRKSDFAVRNVPEQRVTEFIEQQSGSDLALARFRPLLQKRFSLHRCILIEE